MKRLLTAAVLVGAGAASGCSSQSVRDGVWELSYRLAFENTGESAVELVKPREVRVKVVENGNDDEIMEVIQITPVSPSQNLAPMYGEVRAGNVSDKPRIIILHADRDWAWQMYGFVNDDETIEGSNCNARGRHHSVALQGKWNMRWLRDA